MELEQFPVLDVEVYEDKERKVECVLFKPGHFGLRLTIKANGRVTKLGLSRVAAQQIVAGFGKLLDKKTKGLGMQKFIMDEKRQEHWVEVRPRRTGDNHEA